MFSVIPANTEGTDHIGLTFTSQAVIHSCIDVDEKRMKVKGV